MKKFKSFVEDENLKDFEEDLIGEAPPNTADAMKRYKAGKAGFTDKAHLKAKGLIPRADGTKKKSDKYKYGKTEMKTFKQHIKEGSYSGYMGDAQGVGVAVQNSIEDGSLGAHNIHDPEVLKQVNAFVSSIGEREYLNPQKAVNELKEKLSRVGLSFDCQIEGDKGSKTIEVKQFGGRFGKDTDGSDINDDGISHKKEGGLKIEVSHELLQTGTSKVYAKLV